MRTGAPGAASPMAGALPVPPVPPGTRTDLPAIRGASAMAGSFSPRAGSATGPQSGVLGSRQAGGGQPSQPPPPSRVTYPVAPVAGQHAASDGGRRRVQQQIGVHVVAQHRVGKPDSATPVRSRRVAAPQTKALFRGTPTPNTSPPSTPPTPPLHP